MSKSPEPGRARTAPLDKAVLAFRALDRELQPRAWESAARRVARELEATVWRPYRHAMGRGAVERGDLKMVALEACFASLQGWSPARGAAATFLKFHVLKAVSREVLAHSYPVRLTEMRSQRRKDYATREGLGDIRGDEARTRDLLWRTGRIGTKGAESAAPALEAIPGEDGRDLETWIDEARRRRTTARRLEALREHLFRKSGHRRDWRIVQARFFEGRSTHEIGRAEGLSHVRVQQILKEAVRHLQRGDLAKARSERRCASLARRLESP